MAQCDLGNNLTVSQESDQLEDPTPYLVAALVFVCFQKNVTVIGRNPGQVDYVITSSSYMQNAVISRRHSRVVKKNNSFVLFDDSRNGVFINDIKIEGNQTLNEGDIVIFGHLNGEGLPFGTRSRQPDSEYQFLTGRNSTSLKQSFKSSRVTLDDAVEDSRKSSICNKPDKIEVKTNLSDQEMRQNDMEAQFPQETETEHVEVIATDIIQKEEAHVAGDNCVSESGFDRCRAFYERECSGANDSSDQVISECNAASMEQNTTSPSELTKKQMFTPEYKNRSCPNESGIEERKLNENLQKKRQLHGQDKTVDCNGVIEKEDIRTSNAKLSVGDEVDDQLTVCTTVDTLPVHNHESVNERLIVGRSQIEQTLPTTSLEKPELTGLGQTKNSTFINKAANEIVTSDVSLFEASENIEREPKMSVLGNEELISYETKSTFETGEAEVNLDNGNVCLNVSGGNDAPHSSGSDNYELPLYQARVIVDQNSCANTTMNSVDVLDDEINEKSTDVTSDSVDKDLETEVTRIENTMDTLCDLPHSPNMLENTSEDNDRTNDRASLVNDITLTGCTETESEPCNGHVCNNPLNLNLYGADDAAENSGISDVISKTATHQKTFNDPLLTSSPAHSSSNRLSLMFSGKRKYGIDSVLVREEDIKDAIAANVGATVLRLRENVEAGIERPEKRRKECGETLEYTDFTNKPIVTVNHNRLDNKRNMEKEDCTELVAHQFSDADCSDSDLAFSQKSANFTESGTCASEVSIVSSDEDVQVKSTMKEVKPVQEHGGEGVDYCVGDPIHLNMENNASVPNSDDFGRTISDTGEEVDRDYNMRKGKVCCERNEQNTRCLNTEDGFMDVCEEDGNDTAVVAQVTEAFTEGEIVLNDKQNACPSSEKVDSRYVLVPDNSMEENESDTPLFDNHMDDNHSDKEVVDSKDKHTHMDDNHSDKVTVDSKDKDAHMDDNHSNKGAVESKDKHTHMDNNHSDKGAEDSKDKDTHMDDNHSDKGAVESKDKDTHMDDNHSDKGAVESKDKDTHMDDNHSDKGAVESKVEDINQEEILSADNVISEMRDTDEAVQISYLDLRYIKLRSVLRAFLGSNDSLSQMLVHSEGASNLELDIHTLSVNQRRAPPNISDLNLDMLIFEKFPVIELIERKLLKYKENRLREILVRFLTDQQEDISENVGQFEPRLELNFDFDTSPSGLKDLVKSKGAVMLDDKVEAEVSLCSDMLDVKVEAEPSLCSDDCLMMSQDDTIQSISSGSSDQAKLNSSTLSQSQNFCLFLDSAEEDCIIETKHCDATMENAQKMGRDSIVGERKNKTEKEVLHSADAFVSALFEAKEEMLAAQENDCRPEKAEDRKNFEELDKVSCTEKVENTEHLCDTESDKKHPCDTVSNTASPCDTYYDAEHPCDTDSNTEHPCGTESDKKHPCDTVSNTASPCDTYYDTEHPCDADSNTEHPCDTESMTIEIDGSSSHGGNPHGMGFNVEDKCSKLIEGTKDPECVNEAEIYQGSVEQGKMVLNEVPHVAKCIENNTSTGFFSILNEKVNEQRTAASQIVRTDNIESPNNSYTLPTLRQGEEDTHLNMEHEGTPLPVIDHGYENKSIKYNSDENVTVVMEYNDDNETSGKRSICCPYEDKTSKKLKISTESDGKTESMELSSGTCGCDFGDQGSDSENVDICDKIDKKSDLSKLEGVAVINSTIDQEKFPSQVQAVPSLDTQGDILSSDDVPSDDYTLYRDKDTGKNEDTCVQLGMQMSSSSFSPGSVQKQMKEGNMLKSDDQMVKTTSVMHDSCDEELALCLKLSQYPQTKEMQNGADNESGDKADRIGFRPLIGAVVDGSSDKADRNSLSPLTGAVVDKSVDKADRNSLSSLTGAVVDKSVDKADWNRLSPLLGAVVDKSVDEADRNSLNPLLGAVVDEIGDKADRSSLSSLTGAVVDKSVDKADRNGFSALTGAVVDESVDEADRNSLNPPTGAVVDGNGDKGDGNSLSPLIGAVVDTESLEDKTESSHVAGDMTSAETEMEGIDMPESVISKGEESIVSPQICKKTSENQVRQTTRTELNEENHIDDIELERRFTRSASPEFELEDTSVQTEVHEETSNSSINTVTGEMSDSEYRNLGIGEHSDLCMQYSSQSTCQSLDQQIKNSQDWKEHSVRNESFSSELLDSYNDSQDFNTADVPCVSLNKTKIHDIIPYDHVVSMNSSANIAVNEDLEAKSSKYVSDESMGEVVNDTEDSNDETLVEGKGHFVPETQDDVPSGSNTRERVLAFKVCELPYLSLTADRMADDKNKDAERSYKDNSEENDLSQEIPFCEEANPGKSDQLSIDRLELSCHFSSDSEIEIEVPDISFDIGNSSFVTTSIELEYMKSPIHSTKKPIVQVEVFPKESQEEEPDYVVDKISQEEETDELFEEEVSQKQKQIVSLGEEHQQVIPQNQSCIEGHKGKGKDRLFGKQSQTIHTEKVFDQENEQEPVKQSMKETRSDITEREMTLVSDSLDLTAMEINENNHDSLNLSVVENSESNENSLEADYCDEILHTQSDGSISPQDIDNLELSKLGFSRIDDIIDSKRERSDSLASSISGVCHLQASEEEVGDDLGTDLATICENVIRELELEKEDLSLRTDPIKEGPRKSQKRKYCSIGDSEAVTEQGKISVKKEQESPDKLECVLERILKKRRNRSASDDGFIASPNDSSVQSSQEASDGVSSNAVLPWSSELPNVGDVNLERAELHVRRTSDVLSEMEEIFNNKAKKLLGNARVEAWKKVLATLKMRRDLPKTIVAVVGDTGCGKSSLINALLDHSDILPTSGMRACTAVVVEIVANQEDNLYRADIDFLSEKEWLDELHLLLNELKGRDGTVKARAPDPNSEAGVAWSKIRAVYGHFHDGVTIEQLTRKRNVTYSLGRTRNISKFSAKELTQQVGLYIEARETGDGGDYWPIVKHVMLRIPNCRVLSSGTILVDLPGIRDSNAARDKIAKDFLKDCTAVWVVAGVHRAVDDRTAKELLGVHFRRQLLMDGQYGSVSFVCSKTDQIQSSEIVRSLKLASDVEPIEESISEMAMQRLEFMQEVKHMAQEIKSLDTTIQTAQGETADYEKDVQDLEEVLQEDREDTCDDRRQAAEEQLVQLKCVIRETEEASEHNKRRCKQMKIEKRSKEKTLLELEKKVAQKTREVAVICAKARNEYTKKEIRRDFRAGLKEMRRQASLESESEEDNYEEVHEEGDEHFGLTVENLKVFCVSATDYLKLKGKLPRDGPPQTFSRTSDTGIPELQTFVRELTRVRKIQGTQRLLRLVGQYVSDVLSYLCDEGTLDKRTRGATYKVFERNFTELKTSSFGTILDGVSQDLDSILNNSLKVKTSEGARVAAEKAIETSIRWGSKPDRGKPSLGGFLFSTYRAVINRDGAYRSPVMGPIDFNEDLAGPMYTTLTITWDQIFNNKLHQILDHCRLTIMGTMKKFAIKIRQDFLMLNVATERIDRVYVQQLTSASNKLIDTNNELKEYITERQREISRTLTPAVQQSMLGAYSLCRHEAGKGSFCRMKGHMTDHIESEKCVMFDKASTQMLHKMVQLHTEIMKKLYDVVESLLGDLTTLYEPLWEEPVNTKRLREILLPKIMQCNRTMEDLLEEAGVGLEHRSGDEAELFASQQSRDILQSTLSNPHPRQVTSTQQNVLVYDREKLDQHSHNLSHKSSIRKRVSQSKDKSVKSTVKSERTFEGEDGGHRHKEKVYSGSSEKSEKTPRLMQIAKVKVEKTGSDASGRRNSASQISGQSMSVQQGNNTLPMSSSSMSSSHVTTQIGTPSFPFTHAQPSPSRLSTSYKKQKRDSCKRQEDFVKKALVASSSNCLELPKKVVLKTSDSSNAGKGRKSWALSDKTNVTESQTSTSQRVVQLSIEKLSTTVINKAKHTVGLQAKPPGGPSPSCTVVKAGGSSQNKVRVKSEPVSPKSSQKRKKRNTHEVVDLTETSDDDVPPQSDDDLPPLKRFLGQKSK